MTESSSLQQKVHRFNSQLFEALDKITDWYKKKKQTTTTKRTPISNKKKVASIASPLFNSSGGQALLNTRTPHANNLCTVTPTVLILAFPMLFLSPSIANSMHFFCSPNFWMQMCWSTGPLIPKQSFYWYSKFSSENVLHVSQWVQTGAVSHLVAFIGECNAVIWIGLL